MRSTLCRDPGDMFEWEGRRIEGFPSGKLHRVSNLL